MKRNFFLTVLLLAAVHVFAFANEGRPLEKVLVYATVQEGKVLKLNLANLQKIRTLVTLKDLKGNTCYSKVIRKHNGFFSKLNLSKLRKGKYILAVSNGDELISQVVVINDDGLVLSALTR